MEIDTDSIIDLGIIITSFGLILFLAYYVYKEFKINAFLLRRVMHILISLIIILFSLFVSNWVITVASAILFVVLMFNLKADESDFLDRQGKSVGIMTYLLSVFVASLIFLPIDKNVFIFSMLILGIPCGVFGFGLYFNDNKLEVSRRKTIISSFLFFFISFLISFFFILNTTAEVFLSLLVSFLLSVVLTFIELKVWAGWDNFFVSLLSGLILLMLI